ncbi:acyl-CoA dehydrogenase family protein [Streptomyces sp. RKAG293]|uniref:acyl-CoA dehydrogenase family protein n=1 Tax=Streptomyces sp. RKAG293 TaxID=2893403 RepID=UPI002034230C|nr:acyl-CoA dehydrogenase family protein [Streptomyces sp. RKAG293]MCM2419938.1 acyl-CoA/acyl-ACP dehydrogenase [Streptomyces sp. RKAG293]
MDFQPTEDQEALRTGVRELLAGRFPREALRAAVDAGDAVDALETGSGSGSGPGSGAGSGSGSASGSAGGPPVVDRALWRELGEAGFFALRLPEADGGVGLGLPEAVLVFEEAGRVLLPGPLVGTHLAATHLTGPVAAGAAAGELLVALALPPAPVGHLGAADAVLVLGEPGSREPGPRERGSGERGSGERGEFGGTGVATGIGLFAADGYPAAEIRSVDPLTPLHLPGSVLTPARVPGGGAGADPDLAGADPVLLRREAALLTAALQVGSAGRTLEMAVQHARQREQFGRPIGAFQAVKHLCADMLVRLEMARTAVYAAAVSCDAFETAAARLLADDAASRNARDCLQVFGGMGFTWEADVHLHIKRSWVLAAGRADAERHEEELAGELPG